MLNQIGMTPESKKRREFFKACALATHVKELSDLDKFTVLIIRKKQKDNPVTVQPYSKPLYQAAWKYAC